MTSVLRASGLALPAMAVAGSLAALAVRWLRAGPVLLAGLFLLAAADALGNAARTVILIGVDRSLHGAGAGVTLAGVIAVITERRARQRQWAAAAAVAAARAWTAAGLGTAPSAGGALPARETARAGGAPAAG